LAAANGGDTGGSLYTVGFHGNAGCAGFSAVEIDSHAAFVHGLGLVVRATACIRIPANAAVTVTARIPRYFLGSRLIQPSFPWLENSIVEAPLYITVRGASKMRSYSCLGLNLYWT
jgi:hypothetical protein